MYFVDRNEMERTILYMEGLINEYHQHTFDSFLERLSLERMVHMTIESMLDIGNMIIDGFIMRDPGSFEDIVDILVDEKVLPENEIHMYKEVIALRKMLVKDYLHIDHEQIKQVMDSSLSSMEHYTQRVRDYVEGETGTASTFTGQKD
ncbi:DUF86 domain-containing protein [Aquibacillus sp. 3ASR75-11]|uniref:DUF86 domain-containing protein n=1 Tax=Terrihalobacillus insolitus TaxID=2950438 RepID=A0A9X4ALY0_9BACI|nr:DUF86 domain-containing protein [Terrihalobacillus insolitus]MDC3412359.1 DUF86 domain-containing protein [Terrihalobacillus insolitus]MDC3422948.1 DUF86 domain-containing protein [Terrihalobacillus insolitus]